MAIIGLRKTGFVLLFLIYLNLPTAMRGQTFEMLHSFDDSSRRFSGLVKGYDGNFYGTIADGGNLLVNYGLGAGSIFIMTPDIRITTFMDFNGQNGSLPNKLIQGSDGNLYGVTSEGGDLSLNNSRGFGAVFKMTTIGELTAIATFNHTNGAAPTELIQGNDGSFYGTTADGGAFHTEGSTYVRYFGTAFKITTNGLFTKLISFDGTNGAYPKGLIFGTDGNLYGTAGGGTYGKGTVFRMTTNGVLNTLVSFNGTNGSYPSAGLIQANDGNFYGTTAGGGTNDFGTVFRMTPDGTVNTLVVFNSSNGRYPLSALVQGSDGNLYGSTEEGGAYDSGGDSFSNKDKRCVHYFGFV